MVAAVNETQIKTASDGAWEGDSPLNYAFPLLIVQTAVVLFTSRFLDFLLRPLRQPKVVAEILGGILLGPSALGRNKEFLKLVFPPWSTPILESVASIGLLFFLFLVGLELDLAVLRRSGRKAFTIAVAGISLPFVFGAAISLLLRRTAVNNPHHHHETVGYGQFLVFMGVALSITAFPVLARILAELKLLTTHMGQTAMAAAAFNDVAAWILLALAVALPGHGGGSSSDQIHHKGTGSPLISIWVLLSGMGFVMFMMFVVRPAMKWVARVSSSEQDGSIHEACICLTLAGVMVSGFITDVIGLHSIFGAFVFGLTIPKGGSFSERLIERIEDFVSVLLLPLYFASSGLKTDVAKIRGAEAWGILALVIATACAGKILGTFLTAMMCTIPARESLTLGVLMNTKGLVELVVLNIGREKKVLNDEMFAILVLMALFTTFITTPVVVAIYKPLNSPNPKAQRNISGGGQKDDEDVEEELRILACVRGPRDVPPLIRLIESFGTPTANRSLKIYVMHLIEFTDRPSSIVMVQRARRNGLPFINRLCKGGATSRDQIAAAFSVYGQLRTQSQRVRIRHLKDISSLPTMHEDICHVAEDKRVSMIVLPFHRHWSRDGDEGMPMGRFATGWRAVNQRVMENAKCSVGILVDRGFGQRLSHEVEEGASNGGQRRVGVVFIGGPDDRAALKTALKMAQHPRTRVTLLQIQDKVTDECSISSPQHEKEKDEAAMAEFKKRCDGLVECEQRVVDGNLRQFIEETGRSKDYELLIIGKQQKPLAETGAELETHPMEGQELGFMGDVLASSDHGIQVSVLVIQSGDAKTVEGINV
ncbi:PREDICTED: cation/H(+) antiporter 20-like [Tarenaya hassleriana]|uniref:cation/H(+) antiporter 20-like n=1 Tax=Tarenaya hassleriana TaxID=28532 RepID=UPI00053C4778|nr:PREDICTED: cation/H(+) antiporter 20-like [Tarenaya hassleriana]